MAQLCPGLCVGPEFAPDSGWARDRNVESGDELYQRAQGVLHSLRAEYPNGSGTVALGFSRRQVETNWLRMYNCGISHLEFKDHATMMWYLNAHSHIGEKMLRKARQRLERLQNAADRMTRGGYGAGLVIAQTGSCDTTGPTP